jgi:hypothetical protein
MISIFAKEAVYFKRGTMSNRLPHLFRGSSIIRGVQIAEYLGYKLNPVSGYENDVCIYIKPLILDGIKDGSYIDIVEDNTAIDRLKNYPNLNIIVLSKKGKEYVESCTMPNKTVVIPHQHCNFDRIKRTRKEVKTVGTIGSMDSFNYFKEDFVKKLRDMGLEYVRNSEFRSREDVINFYKSIDIQVSYNKQYSIRYQKLLKDALRIKNGASFGIPTVAYHETNYDEFTGGFIEINNIEEMLSEIEKLKNNPDYYQKWSDKALSKSEEFHISNIAQLYKQLDETV